MGLVGVRVGVWAWWWAGPVAAASGAKVWMCEEETGPW